jgi:hypothetical protein
MVYRVILGPDLSLPVEGGITAHDEALLTQLLGGPVALVTPDLPVEHPASESVDGATPWWLFAGSGVVLVAAVAIGIRRRPPSRRRERSLEGRR